MGSSRTYIFKQIMHMFHPCSGPVLWQLVSTLCGSLGYCQKELMHPVTLLYAMLSIMTGALNFPGKGIANTLDVHCY